MKSKSLKFTCAAFIATLTACSAGNSTVGSQEPSKSPEGISVSLSATPITATTVPPGYCSDSVSPYLAAAAYEIRGGKAMAFNTATSVLGETSAAVSIRVAHQTMTVWAKQHEDCVVGPVSKFLEKLAVLDQSRFTRRKNAELRQLGALGALAAESLGIDEGFDPIPGPLSNSGDSNPGLPSDVHVTPKSFDSDSVKALLDLYN